MNEPETCLNRTMNEPETCLNGTMNEPDYSSENEK
jgi:hypothetical protein